MTRRIRQNGLSLVEIMIGIVIIAIAALALGRNNLIISRHRIQDEERSFAIVRANQLLNELRAYSLTQMAYYGNPSKAFEGLDNLDDGDQFSNMMSILSLSGSGSGFDLNPGNKYLRKVNVFPVPTDPLSRQIVVRIFRAGDKERLARVSAIVRYQGQAPAPTQVYDIYTLVPQNGQISDYFADSSVWSLNSFAYRYKGLQTRSHTISRLAYGRDPYYRPSPNAHVYFDSHWSLKGRRIMYWTGALDDGDGHVIADEFNHGVRYPDEIRLYNEESAKAVLDGKEAPEPTWRILLERMISGVPSVRNIPLITANGGAFTFPPMRNYSDAARDPAGSPGIRVVTHPEKIRTTAGENLFLRCYAYAMNPDSHADDASVPEISILVKVPGLGPSGVVSVKKMNGDKNHSYAWDTHPSSDYTVTSVAEGLLFVLKNTPARHEAFTDNTGLSLDKRLQGLEYIPCPIDSDFETKNLDDNSLGPKNTARWRIEIDRAGLPAGETTIETRLGTGASGPACNLSRTYAWINTAPPTTEQYQFLGDPRHMPYRDVKASHGYNWYFARVDPLSSGYTGFDRTEEGFFSPDFQLHPWHSAPARQNMDIPRYCQMLRMALMNSNAVFHNGPAVGPPGRSIVLGGELGPPMLALLWPYSVPTALYVPGASGNSQIGGVEIFAPLSSYPAAQYWKRLPARADLTWMARPWLGELYPDDSFPTWSVIGNLPLSDGFYRERYSVFSSTLGHSAPREFSSFHVDRAAALFVNGRTIGAVGDPFFHSIQIILPNTIPNYDVTAAGKSLMKDMSSTYPETGSVRSAFQLDYSSTPPTGYMEAPYNAERTRLTVETYLELDAAQNILARQAPHNFRSVSGLVRIEDPANTSRFTHFFHDGLNVSSVESSQPRFLPEMIWTIHRACEPSNFPGEGLPPPLVTLSEPVHGETFENPAAINTAWNIEWVRFDGKPYSSNFPPGWTPNGVPVAFNAKFSADNEKTWKFINTGAEALLGVHNSGQNVTSGVAWDVSGLPDGNYVFRLEGFTNRALHYAFHNARVRIKR